MSIKTKLAAITLAALAVTGSIAATATPAEAHGFHHHWGWGVGAGLIGAAVVGSAIAAEDGYYYTGYRHCRWVPQYDAFGRYIGRVRACAY
ncbi:hypothetical protein ACQR1W_04830 [Bradyrhizobium sp. HKCCYLS1011]|uniref:hypothetical protein n=1 Tax=Bradyrhizobium sp. HKCCYLS1011 TaxID=3420733 RepID=UPI003EBDD470